MQRAAESARQITIQTDTAIVVLRNGKRKRISAAQLRRAHDQQPNTPSQSMPRSERNSQNRVVRLFSTPLARV